MTDKHQIKEIIEDFKEDLVRHRRNLHRIPEIGLKLPKTIEYINKVFQNYLDWAFRDKKTT